VVELFEARNPKGMAQITELSGEVAIEDDDEKHVRRIRVTDETGDMVEYQVSFRARLTVSNGDKVEVGQQLTEGSVNPHEKLRVEGVLALQMHLVDEVQQVYRSQGVTIHDKHIELIARQMLRKVHIIEPGDSDLLPGDLVNRRVFEETTRVLTDAAIQSKADPLLGLKENVIIGKLIPAGTGMPRYRNVAVKIKPDAIPEYWLARQRELAELAEGGEPALVGLTRQQAESMLGGVSRAEDD
jgi:DNA-directed RNA polymerase subunit beta'